MTGFRAILACGCYRSPNESWRPVIEGRTGPFEAVCPNGHGMQKVLELFDRKHAIFPARQTVPAVME